MTKTVLYVVEKHYSTKRMKGEHADPFKWIDERVFSENDPHFVIKPVLIDEETDTWADQRVQIAAKEAAEFELARLRGIDLPDYIEGYRLSQRTVTMTDKVLDA